MDLNPFDVSFGMKDNGKCLTRPMQLPRKRLEETSPGKILFQRKPDPDPNSNRRTLVLFECRSKSVKEFFCFDIPPGVAF